MRHEPDGPWYYQQIDLGFNYRMTELQAALGLSQLQRLDEYVAKRHEIAQRYDELLKDLPLTTPWQHPDGYSGLHLYVVRLESAIQHRQIFEMLRAEGVGVNLHYIPVYKQPYFQEMGFASSYCPEAETYYSTAISLPMFPALGEAQQHEVASVIAGERRL
jgi:dTDP-4-amino-4,6-dideoxygalactose transaminase